MATRVKAEPKKSAKFIALCKKYGCNPDVVPEILSFEAACKATGDNPKKLPVVTGIAKRHQKRIVRDYELSIIAEALKKMEKVNYTDGSTKYFPVFEVKADAKRPSGFGLSYHVCDYWLTHTGVGVRHSFASSDVARFYGKHFLKLHTDHLLYT